MITSRISLRRYEQIVELANEGIWTLDADDRTDFINPRGAAILGYRPEEMLGHRPTDFVVPELRDEAMRTLKQIKAGEVESFDFRMQRKDGAMVWISVSAKLLFDQDGNYDGGLGVFSDITARRRSDEELHHSQQMLQFVLNSIPERVFWKDRNSVFLGCNKNFARDAGLEEPSDLVGKDDHQLGWRDSADAYQADDRSVIGTGEPKLDFEELQVLNDGTVRWLTTSKVPLRDADGNIIGVLGTYQDITDRKHAEKRLEEYAKQLERSNDELQQFAYVASHDLQEPLRMVSNYLQLLERREGDRLDATSKTYIDFAVDGARRMKAMIEDILTYSRVESKAGSLVAVDMGEVLDTVLKDLGRVISECDATVTSDQLPTVLADCGQMFQLLENLVGNAIKYRGAAAPRVHVAARRQEREWLFSVCDNGIGIDARYHDYIFQMFQRLHTRDEYPGTGMGLAIAKKIVERHGGRIWVESWPDQGTTFYFTLPSLDASSRLLS